MTTLSEIDAELTALNNKRIELEAKAAVGLIPIYEAFVNRLDEEDVKGLLEDIEELQSQLPQDSLPFQQAGHILVVLTAVKQFFTDEGRRLEELARPIVPAIPPSAPLA